jgi:hypothetical protein
VKKFSSRNRQLALAVAASIAGMTGAGPSLNAANVVWDGSASSDFQDANNWTPAQVPVTTDAARFTGAGAYSISPNPSNVNLSANATVGELDVTGGPGSGGSIQVVNFGLAGFTLNLDASSDTLPPTNADGNRIISGELNYNGPGTINATNHSRLIFSGSPQGANPNAAVLNLNSGAILNWNPSSNGGGPNARGGFFQIGYYSSGPTSANILTGSKINSTQGSMRINTNAAVGVNALNIDGAGSQWNNNGMNVALGVTGSANSHGQVNITNGGQWNEATPYTGPQQNFGDTSGTTFRNASLNVSGAGSRFQVQEDAYSASGATINIHNGFKINVTNGGLVDFSGAGTGANQGKRRQGDTFDAVTTSTMPRLTRVVVDGAGSRLHGGGQWTIAGRGGASDARGWSLNTVSNGGEIVATGYNGASLRIMDHGILKLDGGTITLGFPTTGGFNAPYGPHGLVLNNTIGLGSKGADTPANDKATLTGNGTINRNPVAGGYEAVFAQANTRISPGVTAVAANVGVPGGINPNTIGPSAGVGATGTITITGGDLRTTTTGGNVPEQAATEIKLDFSTSSNAHDRLAVTQATRTADINNVMTYNDIGAGGIHLGGTMDFLLADTITYTTSNLTASPAGTDIPVNTDNLDTLMTAQGYSRVLAASPGFGQYRYFLAENVALDDSLVPGLTLDSLRLEYGAIPEPSSLSLLALGGMAMLRRRRRAN